MTPTDSLELIVVGAGPAGRALAHRAEQAGLRVVLVDPAPDRPWRATYGLYADDAPEWLDPAVVASRSESFVVYTPHRRAVDRGYLVLDPAALQRSMPVGNVVAAPAARVDAGTVTLVDGARLTARHVVDARGAVGRGDPSAPRQTAYGIFADADFGEADTVLMDWRAAGISALRPASFSYRVNTARGRLVQETCLAGAPPIPVPELRRRLSLRDRARSADAPDETVDFPMVSAPRPWRHTGAVAFGAAGGLMNPATGYSVAQSLGAVDQVVAAICADRDPRGVLWPRAARAVHLLRMLGLAVLLSLDAAQLVVFFDAFFGLSVSRQRAYLSSRTDLRGLLVAMAAVFGRCPPRLMATVAAASVRAAPSLLRSGELRAVPAARTGPTPSAGRP